MRAPWRWAWLPRPCGAATTTCRRGLLRALFSCGEPPAARVGLLRQQVAAAVAAAGSGPRDVALLRPVAASGDCGRAANVVDGTGSEWFPDSPEPQWLEVDLQRLCRVDAIRVQWWGDYGKRNSLRVLSSYGGDAAFVPRCRREADAEFNGWTDLRGWADPTRRVRLELGCPGPDCFGLGKQYGVRQVQVLGQPLAEPEETQEVHTLLLRWCETVFTTSETADTQALRLVQRWIQAEATSLAAASPAAAASECAIS